MNHTKSVMLGIGIWVVTLAVAMVIFPIRADERILFESIMPAILTLATLTASYIYFSASKKRYFMEGLCLGIIWTITSLVLDALVFSWGPMKMGIWEYTKDIGVTYLIIFAIPTGIGLILEKKL